MRRLVGLFALAACGDGVPGHDANTTPDATVGLVRLHAAGWRDAEVYFQGPDSSLVLATRLDGDGEANAYVPPGGFVTLVHRDTFTTVLYTWAAVEPGDVLELTAGTPPLDPATMFVSVPPADPSTFFYQLVSPCGVLSIGGAELEPIPVELDQCPSATVGMLVQTFGDGDSYLYRDAVPIQHGTQLAFTGPYQNREPLAVHAINVPPHSDSPRVQAALLSNGYELFVADDFTTEGGSPGVLNGEVPMPMPASATLSWHLQATTPSAIGATTALAWGPPQSSVTLDFGAPLRHYTGTPRYVPAQHAIRWDEDTVGRVADGVVVALRWDHVSTAESYLWNVSAPRSDDPAVRLPVLPASDLHPGADDLVVAPAVLSNFVVEGGYASVRPYLLDAFDRGRLWPIRGASGHVVVETLSPQ